MEGSLADRYLNFAALASSERRGEDYDFRVVNRDSDVAIIAPHGGFIEPGTTQIAEAIAGHSYSFYSFEGLRTGRPHGDLHITSHRFDEPQGVGLVCGCRSAVAIHGRADAADPEQVWMGGRNAKLGARVAKALGDAGFVTVGASNGLSAQDRANICNRGTQGAGVQLELPRSLRNRLIADAELLDRFSRAVRVALEAEPDGELELHS
ncbi:poly-gamma-glutamate hydrolase family protein [Sphingopyxis sp. JAI128]|uniref:poly-gamma-glutamate hydrolase family protein n=1 Tax=Sphingopyxis sp. JAI128 TaxID=2723066 RepID=UPI00390CA144